MNKCARISVLYRKLALCCAVVALVCGQVVPSSAEEKIAEIPVGLIRVSTPVYRPNFSEFTPRFGTYSYSVGWQGIPAADCTVSLERSSDGNFLVSATARTYSFVDIFYKMRYRAEGLLSGIDLTPLKSVVEHRENSKVKMAEVTFHQDGTIESVRQTKGKPAETLSFKPDNFTLDPFAAAFIARALDWKVGETKQFDTFNGKTRYLISLTATELAKVKQDGVVRDAWVIVPQVRALSRPGVEKKLKSAKIYLSADSRREILKVVSSVFIGSVTAEMESFVPAVEQPPVAAPIQVAQRPVVSKKRL